MKNFANVIDNHTYFWVPVVCFVVFLLTGIISGILKGWKRSLYYLGWDVAALILAVFATEPLLKTALKDVNISSMPVNIKSFFFDHEALMPIIMIAWFVVIKSIATLVQIPFRKHLKISDEKRVSARVIGGSISLVGAIPVSVLSANAFTVISGSNVFSPSSDALTYAITFGQYKGLSKDVKDLKNVLLVGSDKTMQNNLIDMFSGTSDLSQITPQNRETIQQLLNGDSIQLVLKNASGSLLDKLKEGATTTIPSNPQTDDNKFAIEQSHLDKLKSTLENQYGWQAASIDNLVSDYLKVTN